MRNKFKWMLLTMATLGLFACSDNLTDSGTPQGPENVSDGFVAFKIGTMNAGTRAGGDEGRTDAEGNSVGGNYEAGDEYAITDKAGANIAFFFDDKGKYLNKSYLQLMGDAGEVNGSKHDHDNTAGEKTYSARIRKTHNGETYCVLILNADPAVLEKMPITTLKDIMTLQDELAASETRTLGTYDGYYTMSNTVYVNESDQDKVVKGPKEITVGDIFETWEDAKNSPITIHVERLVAKFELIYDKELGKSENNIVAGTGKLTIRTADGQDAEESNWGIRIKGWDVNGTETATYWVKNLNDGGNGTFAFAPNATLTTTTFGKWKMPYFDGDNENSATFGWNDPSRVRSYWAVDPHYNNAADVYPTQYRKADNDVNHEVVPGYGDLSDSKSLNPANVLRYISYNNVKPSGNYRYAPENTFGEYTIFGDKLGESENHQFQGDGYMRTGTHVLIAAELLMGEETNNEAIPSDKYCYGGVYWTQSVADGQDKDNNKIENGNLIKHMVEQLLGYYSRPVYYISGTDDTTGRPIYKEFTEEIANEFFMLVPATVKGGDGSLMLAMQKYEKDEETGDVLKDEDGNPKVVVTKLYKATKAIEEGENITTDILEDASEDLQQAIYEIGIVKHFKNGQMYYAIPIQHMVKIDTDKNQWSIGSYGVVRNHWYKLNLKALKKPGTPVDDPDQPIIPNDDPEESGYAAFEIVIVPWHVIEQDVEF